MDADWDEVKYLAFHTPAPGVDFQQISTLAFDTTQELLWVGSNLGRVVSFYGRELQRYTAFRIQDKNDGPVRQFLFHEKGVIALGTRCVHMAIRRGPAVWTIRHPDMKDLQCMSFTSKGATEILVAGIQNTMFIIDVVKGEIVKQVHTEHHYTAMRKNRYICAATKMGGINMLDATSLTVVKSWQAHAANINDMDAQGEFIVTCGASMKQQVAQGLMLDPFVNVFDVKNMNSMKPIPFPPLAAHVRLHPRMLTTAIVISQHGQMHVVDLLNPNTSNVRYANITYLQNFEIAPSGEALAMVDADGIIHLWGSPSKIRFADLAVPIELPNHEEPVPEMSWSVETPLNSVGMHFYREALFSAWPPDIISDVGAPPVLPDLTLLSGLKRAEWGWYGPNTRGLRRNQVEDTRNAGKSASSLQAPKFLSEKAKAMFSGLSAAAEVQAEQASDPLMEFESLKPEAPAMYRNLEIKYSKFGVDDYDFGYFNKTPYAGLENHIANSYANSLLQVMHYTPLLRNLALQHAATACLADPCMLCELGFVFDMLQKAEGSTCHATNLFKALSTIPQARQLGLVEEEVTGNALTTMMQGLSRFLLDCISKEYQSIPAASIGLEQDLFGMKEAPAPEEVIAKMIETSAEISIRCMNCKRMTTRPGTTYVNDLMYPTQRPNLRAGKATRTTFSQVLKMGVERETTSKGWCSTCMRYQSLQMRKTVHRVPAVLAINTAVSTLDHKRLWATPGWLPEEIGVIVEEGQFFCYEGQDLKLHQQRSVHNVAVYSLMGMVVNIDSNVPQKPHLVAMVNVGHSEATAPSEGRWHLFNDFSVRPVSGGEALTFNAAWKMPSVLIYQLKSANNKSNTDWKTNLDTSILYQNIILPADRSTCTVLDKETEKPGAGTVVALDTEFVSLKQPEIQMNSDGQRETIRPMSHALARVSVVRGGGAHEGDAFIDDYIAIKERVVDYLTTYSGITAADLDPKTSPHNLVSLKVAYKKLWVLLNLGCKFLGHGLRQDFRVINMQVPRAQVIDTIELYYLKERLRKLSLAFLAWYLLKEDIQLETHDSIEDARTALKLYRKFLEFQDAGIWERRLEEIYVKGRGINFKPPRKDDSLVQRTDTPPNPHDGTGPSTPLRKMAAMVSDGNGNGGSGSGQGNGNGSGQTLGSGNGGFGGAQSFLPGTSSPLR